MKQGLHGKIMTYDGENQPKSVTMDGVTTAYKYAADGTRLSKMVGGEVTFYFGGVDLRKSGEIETHPRAPPQWRPPLL
ncbi:hypothetical protein AB9F29_14005 [Falsihalocynthiibacter sp. S25ZX9]|uniref:hypothetical protein n=1 Tax=Falsihalocynthiibacter sp. S25ZX9 TaxID=3240870 RepID=UPI00350EB9C2